MTAATDCSRPLHVERLFTAAVSVCFPVHVQSLKDAIVVTAGGAEVLPFLAFFCVLPASLAFFVLYGKLVCVWGGLPAEGCVSTARQAAWCHLWTRDRRQHTACQAMAQCLNVCTCTGGWLWMQQPDCAVGCPVVCITPLEPQQKPCACPSCACVAAAEPCCVALLPAAPRWPTCQSGPSSTRACCRCWHTTACLRQCCTPWLAACTHWT